MKPLESEMAMAEETTEKPYVNNDAACWNCGTFPHDTSLQFCGRCDAELRPEGWKPPKVETPAVPPDNYENKSADEVKAIALASGVEGAADMKKADAIAALRELTAPAPVTQIPPEPPQSPAFVAPSAPASSIAATTPSSTAAPGSSDQPAAVPSVSSGTAS